MPDFPKPNNTELTNDEPTNTVPITITIMYKSDVSISRSILGMINYKILWCHDKSYVLKRAILGAIMGSCATLFFGALLTNAHSNTSLDFAKYTLTTVSAACTIGPLISAVIFSYPTITMPIFGSYLMLVRYLNKH